MELIEQKTDYFCFPGEEDDMNEIMRLLQRPHPLVVAGSAGAGKSTILKELARKFPTALLISGLAAHDSRLFSTLLDRAAADKLILDDADYVDEKIIQRLSQDYLGSKFKRIIYSAKIGEVERFRYKRNRVPRCPSFVAITPWTPAKCRAFLLLHAPGLGMKRINALVKRANGNPGQLMLGISGVLGDT